MKELLRLRAAQLLMDVAHEGELNELEAQSIASVIASGGLAGDDCIQYVSETLGRVTELLQNERQIWTELMPGPGVGPLTNDPNEPSGWAYMFVAWRNTQDDLDWFKIREDKIFLESDLNIARWIETWPRDEEPPDFVTLIHIESGNHYRYTNDMMRMIRMMEDLSELSGRVMNISQTHDDFSIEFQAMHEKALTEGAEFFAESYQGQ
jgi:hypothetical protein